MIIEINETVKRTVEIEFPHYTTDGLHFFKFKNEHNCTQVAVRDLTGLCMAEIYTEDCFPKDWMLLEKVTEKEFNDKFNNVIKILIDGNK